MGKYDRASFISGGRLLENLDTIDWQKISDAYGVPELIRALVSNDTEVRHSAMSELYDTICHQGSVYESAAYVVPFLIELLESDEVQDKNAILGLLGTCAIGPSDEVKYQQQAHDAVARGVKTYLKLLVHEDTAVRMTAPYTLAGLPEYVKEILPVLVSCLASERDQYVRASEFLCLWSFSPEQLREYRQMFQQSIRAEGETLFVKLAAAMAWIQSGEDEDPFFGEAMQIVIEVIMHPEEIAPPDEIWPWMERGYLTDIIRRICTLPLATADAVLSHCLEALAQANYYNTDNVIKTLLFFTFGSVPVSKRQAGFHLTEAQKTVLATLVACDRLWKNNAHLADIMKYRNVPGGREQLRAYLGNAPDI